MYPHERSLVAAMQGKPFALIGVNSDKKDKVKDAMKRENITWRSFWDGGSTGGPIAKQYSIRGWPTIFVIDHRGVIRYKNVRGEKMDIAVNELLPVAELADASEATMFPVVGGLAPELREWTDKTGSHTMLASFIKFEKGKAHLKKEDGEELQLSMNELSKDDQEFIRDLLKKKG
jgi:hypothetical protein